MEGGNGGKGKERSCGGKGEEREEEGKGFARPMSNYFLRPTRL